MNQDQIDLVRAVLPTGRTVYAYYKDRYSLQLLRYALPRPTPVAALRDHPVAPLLQKPRIRQILAQCGKTLSHQHLISADGDPSTHHYTLTLDEWGTHCRSHYPQMSRPGGNLVLQLNFAQDHNREFRRLLKPEKNQDPFNYTGHPALDDLSQERRYTLAWARLDIDLESGEALIEEIQSDWIRVAERARLYAIKQGKLPRWLITRRGLTDNAGALLEYCAQVLEPCSSDWAEAMLSATLFFLREELGLRHIFMHTPESGTLLKNIRYSAPPRSLYSSLPQRFCFREGSNIPQMLANNRRANRLLHKSPGIRLQKLAV